MLARRVNTVNPIRRLQDEVDRAFGGLFRNFPGTELLEAFEPRTLPAVNVWEDDQALYAEAELPGWSMDDIEVCVLGDQLTISGERKTESKENVEYHRREHGFESFRRTMRFPAEIDAENVQAKLRDGLLTVTLPKAEAAKPRKITVKKN